MSIESWPSELAQSAHAEPHAEERSHAEPGDVRQQVLGLQRKLEETASEFARLQGSLASQEKLEQLLRQGRTHLQEMRSRLQQATADRDRLAAELGEQKNLHQQELERLQNQIEEALSEALLQQTRADQRERDMVSSEQEQQHQLAAMGEQLQKATAERSQLAAQLTDHEETYKRFVEERSEERFTFERLLSEATANQREMVQELDEQRQQIETLREAAMRAQSLARQIMRAHEGLSQETHDA